MLSSSIPIRIFDMFMNCGEQQSTAPAVKNLTPRTTPSIFGITAGISLSAVKTHRAGVIPYTSINGKMHFLLAKDRSFGELTDFGGGVKGEETALKGALREYSEESNYIFENEKADLDNSVAITDGKMAILFLHIDSSWYYKASRVFAEKKVTEGEPALQEVSEILWVTEERLINLIKFQKTTRFNRHSQHPRLWKRISNFFLKFDLANVLDQIKQLNAEHCIEIGIQNSSHILGQA